ncbi:DUF456 domain-containing protein [bacterium]|nr:DUF456 domain-containing protein [bacterium]
MEITLKIALPLLWTAGLILIIPGLAGIWVIVLANLVAKLLYPEIFGSGGWIFVIIGIFLAALSELFDWVFGILGAKQAKASTYSIILSLILSIALGLLFTPVIPVVGTLFGVFSGAFLGVFIGEVFLYKKDTTHAAKAGIGALIGKALSVFTKISFAFLVIAYAIMRLYIF